MINTPSQSTPATVQQEIDLGKHYLFLMSDQGIDLVCSDEQISHAPDSIISLDSSEAYRLIVSLQEMFREVSE